VVHPSVPDSSGRSSLREQLDVQPLSPVPVQRLIEQGAAAGDRESGIGGEDGKWGLLRYTQVKTAYHHYG